MSFLFTQEATLSLDDKYRKTKKKAHIQRKLKLAIMILSTLK